METVNKMKCMLVLHEHGIITRSEMLEVMKFNDEMNVMILTHLEYMITNSEYFKF